jgi:PPOX class probable F420-dependent enzyme
MPSRRSQIELSAEEQAAILDEARTVQIASNGHDGFPHVVAMWYAVVDGAICFSTYGTSQKVVNLQRDPRVTAMVELGGTVYNELRGLVIKGRADIIDAQSPERAELEAALSKGMGPRYGGGGGGGGRGLSPKRVIIRIVPESTYSWDHRKLGGVY